MAASNRNYTFTQSQSFIECFVWLNNSQFDLRRKSPFFLNIHFTAPRTLPSVVTAQLAPSPPSAPSYAPATSNGMTRAPRRALSPYNRLCDVDCTE